MNVINIAKDLISIDSEGELGSNKVGEHIYRFLKDIGLKPIKQKLDDEKNFNVLVIGKSELLINGHMDTVPIGDQKKWKYSAFGEIVGDKVYGRGSTDTKGNIACLLAALAEKPDSEVNLSFSAIEETGFYGIEKVMELRKTKLSHVKYGITLEPTKGDIIVSSRGQYTFEVKAKGKAAHGSKPWLGDNAIEKLGPCIENLKKYYNTKLKKRTYKDSGHATLNIGTVSGGSAPNIVPDQASMVIDRRILPNEKSKQVMQEMKAVCKPLEISVVRKIEAAETPSNSKLVKHIQQIHSSLGLNSKIGNHQATTELTAFRQNKIEGIVYGWTDMKLSHAIDEYVLLKDLEKGTKVIGRIIEKM